MKGSENKINKGIGEVQGSSKGYRSFNVHLNDLKLAGNNIRR